MRKKEILTINVDLKPISLSTPSRSECREQFFLVKIDLISILGNKQDVLGSRFIYFCEACLKSVDGRKERIDGRKESIDGRKESIDGRKEIIDGRKEIIDEREESMYRWREGKEEGKDGWKEGKYV